MTDLPPNAIVFNLEELDELMYSLGRTRYSECMKKHTKPADNKDRFIIDKAGLQVCFELLPKGDQIALAYFVFWNRVHPDDFVKYVQSDESKIPGVTDQPGFDEGLDD